MVGNETKEQDELDVLKYNESIDVLAEEIAKLRHEKEQEVREKEELKLSFAVLQEQVEELTSLLAGKSEGDESDDDNDDNNDDDDKETALPPEGPREKRIRIKQHRPAAGKGRHRFKKLGRQNNEIVVVTPTIVYSGDDTNGESLPKQHDHSREGHDEELETLPEDSFSFMMICRIWSFPFWTALCVFLIQVSTYSLLLSNTYDRVNTSNPWGIPSNVNTAVRVTQLIAITITVLTQDDLRTGLTQLNKGYALKAKHFEDMNVIKWFFCVVFRIFEGSLGIVVTFILIITAGTVIDLLLNFTAMEFVSQLDEICYMLANEGFLGKVNKGEAERISDVKFSSKTPHFIQIPPIVFLLFSMVAMLGGWVGVCLNQTHGKYLCQTLEVQFGDDFDPTLSAFSGFYTRTEYNTRFFAAGKVAYVGRSPKTMFAYCDDLKSWTFTYAELESNLDPCNWKAKSDSTASFDLEAAISEVPWQVRSEDGTAALLDHLYLSCRDCPGSIENSPQCNSRGTCSNAICDCNEGWYGSSCEFPFPCDSLEMDERYAGFLSDREWSTSFEMMKINDDQDIVETYNRPVYFNQQDDETYDIILFTGRRWIATYSGYLQDFEDYYVDKSKEALGRYLKNDFHAYFSRYQHSFTSNSMDIMTPVNFATPVGVSWFSTRKKMDVEIKGLQAPNSVEGSKPASLICTNCDAFSNPCLYESTCNDNEECECENGTTGTLCQITPNGNGVCNTFFNNPDFDYDGGDCCESTCISSSYDTDKGTCGRDATGYIDIGYPNCHLMASFQNNLEWIPKGSSFPDVVFGEPPYTVSLSPNGESLAIGEPNIGFVHVFDKDGSQWIRRGPPVEGAVGEGFGSRIKLSLYKSDPNQVRNPLTKPALRLLVHATVKQEDGGSNQMAYLYTCSPTRCDLEEDVIPLDEPMLADISSNGDTVVLVSDVFNGDKDYDRIDIQEIDRGYDFPQRFFTTLPYRHKEHSVAISGSGAVFGIGFASDYNDGSETLHDITDITRVYKLDGFEGQYAKNRKYLDLIGYNWVQIGDDIENTLIATISRIDLLKQNGKTVSLSYDGAVLAVGMPYRKENPGVDVYQLNYQSRWVKRGATIPAIIDSEFYGHFFVQISDDGSTLLVGDSQTSCTYEWNGTSWEMFIECARPGEVALSHDGSTLAIGGNEISVYQRPTVCKDGFSKYQISLYLEDMNDQYRGESFNVEYQMYIMTSADDGVVTIHSLMEYFRSGERSTFSEATCLPNDQCLLFYFINMDKSDNDIGPPGNYSISENGQIVDTFRPQSKMEFFHRGKCTICDNDLSLARFFVESNSPFDWYIRDGGGQLNAKGSILQNTIHPSFRSWRTRLDVVEWFMISKDICVPEFPTCFEISLRSRGSLSIYPAMFGYSTPILLLGNDTILLKKVWSDDYYGEIYTYNSCKDISEVENSTYIFEDDFAPLSEVDVEPDADKTTLIPTTLIPTFDDSIWNKPDVVENPCDRSKPTIIVQFADEVCNQTLGPNMNYIFNSSIQCYESSGPTLSNNTCMDCRGFSISNSYQDLPSKDFANPIVWFGAVIPEDVTEAVIYNCGFEEFDVGVNMFGSGNAMVHSETLASREHGLVVKGSYNDIRCSKISENFETGIDIDGFHLFWTTLSISHTLIEQNLRGVNFYNADSIDLLTVECSVFNDNFQTGIETSAPLNLSKSILHGNGWANIKGDYYYTMTPLTLYDVSSCGAPFDYVNITTNSNVTCEALGNSWIGQTECENSCTGECKESLTCSEDVESILPEGCNECSHPGRYVPQDVLDPNDYGDPFSNTFDPDNEFEHFGGNNITTMTPSDSDSDVPSDVASASL